MPELKQSATEASAEFLRRRLLYEEIVSANQGALLRCAMHLCSRVHSAAEEYVQDTLVRGYEAFLDGKFKEGTNARAWLIKILTNRFLHDRRRDKFHHSEPIEKLQSSIPMHAALCTSQQDSPEWLALAHTFSEPIELALDSLPDDLRLAVLLADVEDLTYKEVAGICQIPVGTVRSRLFRARRELAKWLTVHSHLYDQFAAPLETEYEHR